MLAGSWKGREKKWLNNSLSLVETCTWSQCKTHLPIWLCFDPSIISTSQSVFCFVFSVQRSLLWTMPKAFKMQVRHRGMTHFISYSLPPPKFSSNATTPESFAAQTEKPAAWYWTIWQGLAIGILLAPTVWHSKLVWFRKSSRNHFNI